MNTPREQARRQPISGATRSTAEKASYDGGQGSDCAARGTQFVGTYPANRWGLYDMLGNVWEWCEDNWHPDYHGAPGDGSAWRGGDASMRILRGGAWNYSPSGLRSADRNWFPPDRRTSFIGLRVASDLNAEVAYGAFDPLVAE